MKNVPIIHQHVVPNFLLAGVAKAGTTAVFDYLADHPQVCGASEKETRFFEREYTGNSGQDIEVYSKYFPTYQPTNKIVMEATPHYLQKSKEVAPRINTLLPDVKLLFILRNPTERLYSYYNYHVWHKDFDQHITFDDFVDKCLLYSRGGLEASNYSMAEWFFRFLDDGLYFQHLVEYIEIFSRDSVKIMFFEDLRKDTLHFMEDICRFLDIDGDFYSRYSFVKKNVTFHPRDKTVHRITVALKERFRGVFEYSPIIRNKALSLYRKINMKTGYPPISRSSKEKLDEYYRLSNHKLMELLDLPEVPWVS